MPERQLPIEQVLILLGNAPTQIAAFTAGLASAKLRTSPAPGQWSANAVLAHLRACADVWGGCIATIIAQDRPRLRAVNPRTWIDRTDYLEIEFQASLQAFAAQRTELLTVLSALAPEDWTRSASVTGAGKVLVRTVHSYAQWLAVHERSHVKQIKHIAARL